MGVPTNIFSLSISSQGSGDIDGLPKVSLHFPSQRKLPVVCCTSCFEGQNIGGNLRQGRQ